MKKTDKETASLKSSYLIVTIILGIIFFILGECIFEVLTKRMFTPLGILLYFLLFFSVIFVGLTVLLCKKLSAADFSIKVRSAWKILLVLLLAFLLLIGFFEFLYELGKEEIPEPTSLIFLIDDSGSMSGNEPDRIMALNDVMKDNKLPFAVYSFTENAKQLRNMEVFSSNISEQDLGFVSSGGTSIIPSIKQVLNDLEQGLIRNPGQYPKIILVSDGASSSIGLRSMAKKCWGQNVSISSIGMEGCSESLLKRIAETTGGVYVPCTDITMLGENLTKAVASDTSRNLLSERIVFKNDGLYAVLRILFLSLAGVVWSALKIMLISEDNKFCKKMFIFSVILCILGAVILEFGNGSGISASFLRLVFDVLWAVTLGTLPPKSNPGESVNTGSAFPPPPVPNGTMDVKMVSQDKPSTDELKQINGESLFGKDKNDGDAANGNGFFKSGGIFDSNTSKNQGSVFGNNNSSQNGLFGNKNNNDGGNNGIFGGK